MENITLTMSTMSPLNASLENETGSGFDEYDYDYDPAAIDWKEFSFVAFFYMSTLIFGLVGNILVIFSIARYRRMHSVTNCFLLSLALADLMLILFCVPIKFAKWFSHTWDFGLFMCKFVHYIQNVSVICSVLTLTMMSLERYYAILHPMRAKYMCTVKQARRVILVVWFLSIVMATPTLYGRTLEKVGVKIIGYWCIKDWPAPVYFQAAELYMLLLILIIPLGLMTFAYTSICVELWVVTSRRATISAVKKEPENGYYRNDPSQRGRKKKNKAAEDDKTRKQVIKMLVTVIVLFAICWAPRLIDQVLVAFGVLDQLNHGHLKPLRQAFSLLSYFNSCINPIVYAFMSKNFREMFKHAARTCTCLGRQNFRRGPSFQTRSTSLSFSRTVSVKADMEIDAHASSDFQHTEYKDMPV